ncbi:MAG: mannose-6-phosphate isomerase, class I [Ilumatobacteraceae bacterium]
MRSVRGVVQHYAWGDHHFIPALLGVDPDDEPWAELWLGTHPNGPATLDDGTLLVTVTGELPYLLKVLSAREPLSLQAHPTIEQAVDGAARGIFDDPNAKPELMVALTEFEAFCGVRPVRATVDLLRSIGASPLADTVAADGPGAAMRGLYVGDIDPGATLAACSSADGPEAEWVRALANRYPGDPSVVVTLLLNYVVLQPGQAIHLTAGNLHGYLRGAGIELMQASDNVVRGGLTRKPVDVELLLEIVDPTPLAQPIMTVTDGRYPLPEAGVTLVELRVGDTHVATGHELTVALDGTTLYLPPGTSFVADAVTYVVTPHTPRSGVDA